MHDAQQHVDKAKWGESVTAFTEEETNPMPILIALPSTSRTAPTAFVDKQTESRNTPISPVWKKRKNEEGTGLSQG